MDSKYTGQFSKDLTYLLIHVRPVKISLANPGRIAITTMDEFTYALVASTW